MSGTSAEMDSEDDQTKEQGQGEEGMRKSKQKILVQ